MHTKSVLGLLLATVFISAAPALGVVKTWNGTTGPWSDDSRWTNGLPVAGDEVEINSGSVLLTEATPDLQAFTMNGGTLTFSNWTTRLAAGTILLDGKAVVTTPVAFTNTVMSNRVWFSCSALTLATGAVINVDIKGYKGGISTDKDELAGGHGPGGGIGRGGAASYGGQGADRRVPVYGEASAPMGPGSGGGGDAWGLPGNGGGAVRIEATGVVSINGTITANGGNGVSRSAGGSGGAIFVNCLRIEGIGVLSAAGGVSDYTDSGCGSGGGRIAVIYDSEAQAAVPIPGIRFYAHGGTIVFPAEAGTVYFPDTRFLETEVVTFRGQWVSPGLTSYAWDALTISNGWLVFPQDGFVMTVTNDLTIIGNNSIAPQYKHSYRNAGRLELTNGVLHVGGNLVLTNTATLYMHAGPDAPEMTVGGDLLLSQTSLVVMVAGVTNGAYLEAGARLAVTGKLEIGSASWIYPISHWTNGGSVFMEAGSLDVDPGSGINADYRGFGNHPSTYSAVNFGPGKGGYSLGGGGYGGKGGNVVGGKPYGSYTNPAEAGSAGADQASNGGSGGGLIRLQVAGGVTLNGTLTASGQAGYLINSDRRSGGGSGGGVFISCAWIAGTNGWVAVDGGLGHDSIYASGGGGGGRIAVIYDPLLQDAVPLPSIRFSALGGRGTATTFMNQDPVDGELGTLYFPDSRFLTEPINHSGLWLAPGLEDWTVQTMVVSNRWLRIPLENYKVTVEQDLLIVNNGRLDLTNSTLTVGGNVMMTNRGTLSLYSGSLTGNLMRVDGDMALLTRSYLNVYAAPTNEIGQFGGEVNVGGLLSLGTNCWVWPFSNPKNGGSPRFFVGGLDIETASAGFNASARGCLGGTSTANPGYGIGRGIASTVRGGGGYGGRGGIPGSGGGISYGSAEEPGDAGSGGAGTSAGGSSGGASGGLVWIASANRARINGGLYADGQAADTAGGTYGGGGSGGGIYLRCLRLSGTGVLTARGGNGGTHSTGGGGSGGGGRIAVWRGLDESALTTNILAGGAVTTNKVGEIGSYYLGSVRVPGIGTVIQVR